VLVVLFCPTDESTGTDFHSSPYPLFPIQVQISGWQIILLATCFQAGFLLSLFFNPEEGGDMFLRNVG
jgi:hypothetical protein